MTPSAIAAGAGEEQRGTEEEFSPALMLDVELADPLPAVLSDGQHKRAWVLGRLHSEPIGSCVVPVGAGGLAPGQFAALLWREFRDQVSARFSAAGLPPPAGLDGTGLGPASPAWPYLSRRSATLDAAPFISVVVCTRNRPEGLRTCLGHLARQEYPRFEVVVVDNAPEDDAVAALLRRQGPGVACHYVMEPRRGLSWARNAGVAAASGEIIAFLDDDEEPDTHWLTGLACGFARGEHIGSVSGMILPARLDTAAQEWFETAGGHSKGRGFVPDVFSAHGSQSPLFPLPPFGAGGNMAFRREALTRIGGFDVALGAGTRALGGEDTLALTLVLLAGYSVAYEPSAFVRHHHYADPGGLARQMRGYGTGLTAYYLALLRHRPRVLPALLRLIPQAARYLRGDGSRADGGLPRDLLRVQRRGMLAGPVAYLGSTLRQSRLRSDVVRR